MIVWSLFDSGNGSYKQAIDKYFPNELENYSIGIDKEQKNNHFINLNLADFSIIFGENKMFDALDKLPKPDIILASPPCNSFSLSSAMKGGNAFYSWTQNKDKHLDIRTDNEIESKNDTTWKHYANKSLYTRVNGELCAFNTIEIIRHYQPKYWVIENPRTSRLWYYLEHYHNFTGYQNIAHYSPYDSNFSRKPTCFLSNLELNLKQVENIKVKDKLAINPKQLNDHKIISTDYNVRSNIPLSLVKDILDQILEYDKTNN